LEIISEFFSVSGVNTSAEYLSRTCKITYDSKGLPFMFLRWQHRRLHTLYTLVSQRLLISWYNVKVQRNKM